jgi:hypothetical protein
MKWLGRQIKNTRSPAFSRTIENLFYNAVPFSIVRLKAGLGDSKGIVTPSISCWATFGRPAGGAGLITNSRSKRRYHSPTSTRHSRFSIAAMRAAKCRCESEADVDGAGEILLNSHQADASFHTSRDGSRQQ